MTNLVSQLTSFFSSIDSGNYLRAFLLILCGLIVAKLISFYVARFTEKLMEKQAQILVRRGTYFLVLFLFVVSALLEIGFDLSILLGAAGIFSVAIGFASQTSASNLISGFFLMGEKSFTIGDVIKVNDTIGEVLSIDMLSVKIRTNNNLFVRIPNESLIKSECTTLTRFPIRRHDIQIGVAYKEDIEKVKKVLFEVADKNPLCLEEPKPVYFFLAFGDSSINLQFSVWAKRESFFDMKNSMYEQIKLAFEQNNIEIPFPQRSISTASQTAPFPVQIQDPSINTTQQPKIAD